MPWLTPGSNDSGGVLDDWRQPSCVKLVEITGLLPAATAGIGVERALSEGRVPAPNQLMIEMASPLGVG
jgi:hypothetical protein